MWARVSAGAVCELTTTDPAGRYHPDLVWVDAARTAGVAPGWTYDGTTFRAPPAPPTPTLAQQAAAALASGVVVASPLTPALNGTYAIDATAQGLIGSVSVYIVVNGKFPGGVMSYPWLDRAGVAHIFPSPLVFQAFASAIADRVSALQLIALTGSGTLPAGAVAIP